MSNKKSRPTNKNVSTKDSSKTTVNNKVQGKIMDKKMCALAIIACVAVGFAVYSVVGSKSSGSTAVSQVEQKETVSSSVNATGSDTKATTPVDNNATANQATTATSSIEDKDLVIDTASITDKASFYKYDNNGKPMEVLAVKASDGTIRTAFNTCQVCYSSGKGYYKLEGNELVCQNCGNRFTADQVAITKGGCNPVPISTTERKEANGKITIPGTVMLQASAIFANWSK